MASWVQARRVGEAAVPPEMGDGGVMVRWLRFSVLCSLFSVLGLLLGDWQKYGGMEDGESRVGSGTQRRRVRGRRGEGRLWRAEGGNVER